MAGCRQGARAGQMMCAQACRRLPLTSAAAACPPSPPPPLPGARIDFNALKAPAGYVAGMGRGAAGFTTRSDIGPSMPTPGAAKAGGDKEGGGDAGGDDTKFDAFLGNDTGVLGATGARGAGWGAGWLAVDVSAAGPLLPPPSPLLLLPLLTLALDPTPLASSPQARTTRRTGRRTTCGTRWRTASTSGARWAAAAWQCTCGAAGMGGCSDDAAGGRSC